MRETMMNVEVSTQIRENYGAHEWDGNGECPQYWKSKGGEDYIISGAPSEEAACCIPCPSRFSAKDRLVPVQLG